MEKNPSFLELHQKIGALTLEKINLEKIINSHNTTLYIGAYHLSGEKSFFDIISNDWENNQFPNFPFNLKNEIKILIQDAIDQYQNEIDLVNLQIKNFQ
jgi:hypothetical protein